MKRDKILKLVQAGGPGLPLCFVCESAGALAAPSSNGGSFYSHEISAGPAVRHAGVD